MVPVPDVLRHITCEYGISIIAALQGDNIIRWVPILLFVFIFLRMLI